MTSLIEPQTPQLLRIAGALLFLMLFCAFGIKLMQHQLKKQNQQNDLKTRNILIALPFCAFAFFTPLIIGFRLQQYWHYAPIAGLITGLLLLFIGGGWLSNVLERKVANKTVPVAENRQREQKD